LSLESTLRKLFPYTTAGVVIALLYVGWIFFSRWNDNHEIERAAEDRKAKAQAKIVEMYGSGKLTILNFYVTPGLILKGKKGMLCYGVSNALTVRIEPGVEGVKPALSRCVEIAPAKDTEYKITAEDAAGHLETKTLLVRVIAPAFMPVLFFPEKTTRA